MDLTYVLHTDSRAWIFTKMQRFRALFGKNTCKIIGMVHLDALPGTPIHSKSLSEITEKAIHEAQIYQKHNLDAILIENMHDVPYIQQIGPEIISSMTRVALEVKKSLNIALGLQILACGNKEALAVAKAVDADFIRCEGFVFAHVADEGWTNACAGDLLRYRRQIDAGNVLVFTDIKKKHSSHAVTGDVSLVETAHAAEFFLSDGLIVTGNATGDPAKVGDLEQLKGRTKFPLLVGSGVTEANLEDYFGVSDAVIVGSHFKKDGYWGNELSESRVECFMDKVRQIKR